MDRLLEDNSEKKGEMEALQAQNTEQESINLALERSVANLRKSSEKFQNIR